MQINTEVYGARSTWRRDADGFSWYNANIPDDMQFKRGQYDRLIDYVNNNKMSFGQHIDYSICYAAHGEGMPLASVRTWYTPNEGGQWKAYTYKRNKVTGWFFGHQLDSYNNYAFYIRNPKALLVDRVTNSYTNTDLWLPNGQNANYPEQQSKLIAPIVEFPTRGAYFGIEVCLYKASSASFYRKPLAELRSGDWSEYIIVSAYGILYTYANNERDYQMNSGRCCVCPNETYEFTREGTQQKGLSFLKYCQFNGMSSSVLPIFGWVDGGATSEYFGGRNHAVKRMFWNGTDSSGYSIMFIDTVPNAVFNALDFSDWGKAIEAYCTVTPENLEAIRKAAAAYGLFFTEQNPDNLRTNANRWTNSAMFCGVLDENGVGHGEYTQGAENRDNPVYNMGSSTNSNYDPTTPPSPVDPNTYSLTTNFNTVGSVASTTKQYVINGDGLRGLSGEMWTIMSDLVVNPEDVENLSNLSLDAFLTSNPIDAIVSVKKFPLDHVPHGETLENVYLGKYRTSAGAYELAAQQAQYNFSAIPVYPKFGGCFLDYAPYTTMQLYIPFCGTIEIDPADFMGRNLSVEMNMDFITGTVTAYVLSNELVIQTATGQCAIDVPITGTESATVDAAYQSAVINERQARNKYYQTGLGVLKHPIKSFLSPVSTAFKSISSAQSWAQTEYELTHIQEPLRQIGAASPLNSWALEFVCRLIIYYPDGEIITFNANNEPALIDDKVKAFGDVNGFATVETGVLSNFEGFTQVSSVDLDNVKATQNELEMIRNLLQGGVYL